MITSEFKEIEGESPRHSPCGAHRKYLATTHTEWIHAFAQTRCGPRILTFFLYLSDVEGGKDRDEAHSFVSHHHSFAYSAHVIIKPNPGATNFTKLDIAVKPKLGRALLWPSVLNSNPKDEDPRTYHEAQDVVEGIKFAANAWIHLHDYMAAADMGCT